MPNLIPPEYDSVTPYLIVSDGAAALDLYARAFGATEHLQLTSPDGKMVLHAEIKIGDSIVMLSGSSPGMDVAQVPANLWPPVSLMLYVEDVDAVYKQAVDAGCTSESEPTDQFYGDRSCKIRDPFGHCWSIATHIEDVSQEEIERRAKELFGG